MKTIYKIFFLLLISGLTACNFLDIVPDEKEKGEDAFKDVSATERYLYSCYAYLPQPRNGPSSLDFMTGDEVITAFEHETFARFPKGTYTASEPVISYWDTFFLGLKQCYTLLNNIGNVPNLPEDTKKDYIAQINFLIGYYHFLLSRCYGPIIIIDSEPNMLTPPNEYKGRTNFDKCVEFICNKMDEAAADLPAKRPVLYYGLATSVAAKAIKAKMLLMAASPLFNGNSEFYANFNDKEGNPLMPLQYDPQKWEKAKVAMLEAIRLAEENGYALYKKDDLNHGNKEPLDPIQHRLRYNIMDPGNSEIIFADSRKEGYYGIQNKCAPYSANSAWNGTAPTMAMINRFYTKNGLPIDVDPDFTSKDLFSIVTVDNTHASQAEEGGQTLLMHLDREPRFYAWVAFHGGYYEIMSSASKGAYANDASYKKYSNVDKGKLVCNFIGNGNCGKGGRSGNYSPSGYLNKKGVDPGNQYSKDLKEAIDYPWPLIRLADLYLGYAEACIETGDLTNGKQYLNKVRERAGIPTVEQSWETIAGKTLDQKLLREIVRQERMIEFYFENQNFWDMRRWLLAEKYFNVKAKGLNVDATDINSFAVETEIIFERKFISPTHYLLPIPQSDINKNLKLVQNPGY